MVDETHVEEQRHLSQVYETILALRDDLTQELEAKQKSAEQDLAALSDEIRLDMADIEADEQMETLAAIETLNAVIDAYNQRRDFQMERLQRVLALLRQPYFAKVRLIMRPGKPARDVYIGAVGLTDKNRIPIVVDWRSPVAETYYKQENGPTSFCVDGRVRNVELTLRRQFDIERDVLKMYFDTTVAIEDSLLLKALKSNHTEKLQAITATIQREQNEVVRHEDTDCLLVSGVAGAGKTSVMLQRVAYLFYQERASLKSDQVVIITPTDVFSKYIDQVLPSMGETNPHIFTWASFVESQGLSGRDAGTSCTLETMQALKEALDAVSIEPDDIRDIRMDDITLLSAAQIMSCLDKFSRFPLGPRRFALVRDEMHERLERRISNLARRDDYQEDMLGLDVDAQVELFGETVAPGDEQETIALTRTYLADRFKAAHDMIDDLSWFRFDRLGSRMLGGASLDACAWLWLRHLISGEGATHIRYVMVDEVQDLTAAQLTLIAHHFRRAHFLLLGDEHQAIRDRSASWDEIRAIFREACGQVDECTLDVSYRSSPEITELFSSLLPAERVPQMASVREHGQAVSIICAQDSGEYLSAIRACVEGHEDGRETTAIICRDEKRVRWLAKQLPEHVRRLGRRDAMPASGVWCLDLKLAKGLEFDRVILADGQAEVYGADDLSRRCLYTALSRAMHEVTIVCQGEPTALLAPYLDAHPEALRHQEVR